MTSLDDFDDTVLGLIIAHSRLFDRVLLRGTCRRFRAMIPAPRKRIPQKQWRWAQRRNELDLAQACVEEGARDLQRYACEAATIDECRAAWSAQFSRIGLASNKFLFTSDEAYYARQLELTRAIIARDSSAFVATARADSQQCPEVRIRAGKYLSDEAIRASLVGFGNLHDRGDVFYAISNVMFGALKKGRVSIALECARFADALGGDVRYRQQNMRRDVILSGNVQACRELPLAISQADKFYMGVAAESGSREMCEYVRAILGEPFPFGHMVIGAAQHGHLDIVDLALKWADECARDDEIDFTIPNKISHRYTFRADGILDVMKIALVSITAAGGTSAMFTAIAERCDARAKLACSINYEYALRMLKQPTRESILCIAHIKKHEDVADGPIARDESPFPSYTALFATAARASAYWLTDIICKLAEKNGKMREINVETFYTDEFNGTNCDIIALQLRGYYTRKIRASMVD